MFTRASSALALAAAGPLRLQDDVTILGLGARGTELRGNGEQRVIEVDED